MNEGSESSAAAHLRLLTPADMRAALGNICERRFHELRSMGVIDPPLELGPRTPRWTPDDLAAAIARLPRRGDRREPESLAQGRRRRIEHMKAHR